mmetsp:Transcript_13143/g.20778  ORF Transcript_13143/g.20778 Transcript_13143/m.20778 type:complete len:137 (+) Transcript_13143:31-441(+)
MYKLKVSKHNADVQEYSTAYAFLNASIENLMATVHAHRTHCTKMLRLAPLATKHLLRRCNHFERKASVHSCIEELRRLSPAQAHLASKQPQVAANAMSSEVFFGKNLALELFLTHVATGGSGTEDSVNTPAVTSRW